MKPRNPRRRIWITIGLIAIIIFLLVYFVEWEEVLSILSLTNWGIMLVGGGVLLIGFVFISSRWRYVLADKPNFMQTFHADSIGYMVTILSPIPGPVMRVVALTQSTKVSLSQATPAMIVDTLLGTVMRLVALILAIITQSRLENVSVSILIGVLLIAAALGFIIWLGRNPDRFIPKVSGLLAKLPEMRRKRLQGALTDLRTGLSSIDSLKSMLIALLLSLLMWSCFLVFQYLGFQALPVDLTNREMLTLAMATLVVLPPSAPAMIGVYQGVLIGFLLLFRIADSSILTAYAILVFAIQLVLWVFLGSWGLISTRSRLGDLIQQSRAVIRRDNNKR
ncbi:MAG: hypothetical protein AMJ56_02075 [Anaerolineae bacterium SG8_19]|jgi:uncharacterized protein (TIRG00374 family)|nr:MAG: hypothetical protein AMJ56_02075 [Anaerolineae bacterium SG8_19]